VKLLTEDDDFWKVVVAAKYGVSVFGNVRLVAEDYRNCGSGWWRDICRVDGSSGWFAQAACKKVGNGGTTKFWKDVWLGNQSLQSRFPRLFSISSQKEGLVSTMGRWDGGVWRWELLWRQNFFVWEEVIFNDLLNILIGVSISLEDDRWVWNPGLEESFSVKATYVYLDHLLNTHTPIYSLLSFTFKFIWKCGVPSKVSAFAWQVLLDKVPTRDNLRRRGVVGVEGSSCPFCQEGPETVSHLFLHCRIMAAI
jgi:hypothetical protein